MKTNITALGLILLAGCDNATNNPAPPVAPPTQQKPGIQVHAPGVDVDVTKDRTKVRAPGTDVDVEKK